MAKNAHGLTALGAAMTLMQASDKVRADVDGLRRQLDPMLVEEVIVKKDNPFEVLDEKGVGKLMELAVKWGRSVKSDLLVGICGEHGGHRLLRQDRARRWYRGTAERMSHPAWRLNRTNARLGLCA